MFQLLESTVGSMMAQQIKGSYYEPLVWAPAPLSLFLVELQVRAPSFAMT